uniref:Sensory neuron membrane protein 1 n=1 Tax=Culicoides sonorensis TaxID=179676 RepID=A0A336KA87_CULSO
MENPGLEPDELSTSGKAAPGQKPKFASLVQSLASTHKKINNKTDENTQNMEPVIEIEATQALVDTVDGAKPSHEHHVQIVDSKDVIDGIRKKVELKPSPLLYGKVGPKQKKREKALTLWGKIWRKIRYALPILLIATMIAINQSIHRRETKQKKVSVNYDYQRLFQVLDRDTPLLREWQSQEITRKFYVFNWTNSHEINKYPSIKPHFDEIGPFVFNEILSKTDLAFDPDDNKVTFNLERTKTFNALGTTGDLNSKIITPNNELTSISNVIYGSISSPAPYFYHQNLTSERKGRFTVFTGKDNPELMNQLIDRNGDTLGEIWSDISTPDFIRPLKIYSPDVCISINFNDIQLTESGRQWASSCIEMEPITDQTTVEKCKVVKRVNRCRGQSGPFTVSFPHFYTDKNYEFDESYLRNVDGLKPDKKKHRSYVKFELKTGKLLEKNVKLQFNVPFKLDNTQSPDKTSNQILMPLFWYEEIIITERALPLS